MSRPNQGDYLIFLVFPFSLIFPELRRPQVGQKQTCDRTGTAASHNLLDWRPPQLGKNKKLQNLKKKLKLEVKWAKKNGNRAAASRKNEQKKIL